MCVHTLHTCTTLNLSKIESQSKGQLAEAECVCIKMFLIVDSKMRLPPLPLGSA